ncbi:MAG TPA: OsmC family protein [Arachidicoccus sp.]|nr:OsmC family protein [Arachidicoccus sp.]
MSTTSDSNLPNYPNQDRHNSHQYPVRLEWTGNSGTGTSSYTAYQRSYQITAVGKPVIEGSSDPKFRGDPALYNPEELLVASISSCHMLWYLHLCAVNKVVLLGYTDQSTGIMEEDTSHLGGGRFTSVSLYPEVTVASPDMIEQALALHEAAHKSCYIANSVNFPVHCYPKAESNR